MPIYGRYCSKTGMPIYGKYCSKYLETTLSLSNKCLTQTVFLYFCKAVYICKLFSQLDIAILYFILGHLPFQRKLFISFCTCVINQEGYREIMFVWRLCLCGGYVCMCGSKNQICLFLQVFIFVSVWCGDYVCTACRLYLFMSTSSFF